MHTHIQFHCDSSELESRPTDHEWLYEIADDVISDVIDCTQTTLASFNFSIIGCIDASQLFFYENLCNRHCKEHTVATG